MWARLAVGIVALLIVVGGLDQLGASRLRESVATWVRGLAIGAVAAGMIAASKRWAAEPTAAPNPPAAGR